MNWFLERGHTDITVFVPSWRKEQPRADVPITGEWHLRRGAVSLPQEPVPLQRDPLGVSNSFQAPSRSQHFFPRLLLSAASLL